MKSLRSFVHTLTVFTLTVAQVPDALADFAVTPELVIGQADLTSPFQDQSEKRPERNSLYLPHGETSCNGVLFVADTNNSRVLGFKKEAGSDSFKMLPDIVLGQKEFNLNPYTETQSVADNRLRTPYDVFCDGENLYVADTGYHRVLIWKNAASLTSFQSANIVLGQRNFLGAVPGSAVGNMFSPTSVWATQSHIFVTESGNHRVQIYIKNDVFEHNNLSLLPSKFVLGGPLAGTSRTSFRSPHGVYSDGTRLFVADTSNHRILVWNSIPNESGKGADLVFGQDGSFDTNILKGDRDGAHFVNPYRVQIVNNNLIVSDTGNSRVLIYPLAQGNAIAWPPNENEIQVVGQGALNQWAGRNPALNLINPVGVYSPTPGTYIIADRSFHRLIKAGPNGFDENVWGQASLGATGANRAPWAGGMTRPGAAVVARGKLFVSDQGNDRILVYNNADQLQNGGAWADFVLGQISLTSNDLNPNADTTYSTLNTPTSMSADNDRLYVADSANNRVLYWNLDNPYWDNRAADGVVGQTTENGHSSGLATLSSPFGVYTDGKRLFVADSGNHRVLVWKIGAPNFGNTSVATVIGQANLSTGGGRTGKQGMNNPRGVYSDGSSLYVSDSYNNRVLVWTNVDTLQNGAPADFVLGQENFESNSSCVNADTADLGCLAIPGGIAGDGKRLFVAQRRRVDDGIQNFYFPYARVIEWALPITANNQAPVGQKWRGVISNDEIFGMTLDRNRLWIGDRDKNRVVRFSDSASYVDVTANPRGVPVTANQKTVIPALDFSVNTFNLTMTDLAVRQEGAQPGDIQEVLLCGREEANCANSPLLTLVVGETPGLFEAHRLRIPLSETTKDFTLAYRLSPTAKVGQSVGLSLHVNSGFFGFADIDGTRVFVNNTAGPARTSALTRITDFPDTLVVASARNISGSEIPQNVFVPFLEFDVNASEDSVFWQTLKLKATGTANPSDVSVSLRAFNGVEFEDVNPNTVSKFDNGGNVSIGVNAVLTPTPQKFQIFLKAGSATTGTLGVDIDPATNPFLVPLPDNKPSFTRFGSAVRGIVSHTPNTLHIAWTDLVVPNQTAQQAARVLLGKLELSTNADWTHISRWPITRRGISNPADVEKFEFWKDDGDGVFDSDDRLLGASPHDNNALADVRFTPELRIETSVTTLWVTVQLTMNAVPENRVGASLSNRASVAPLECDPNTTTVPNSEFANAKSLGIVPSQDVVFVQTKSLSRDLAQGDLDRALLQMDLWTDKNTASWESLTLKLEGTATKDDVKGISLYRGIGEDRTRIVQKSFSGTETTLSFAPETLTTSTQTYSISVDISDLAVPGRTVVLSLADPGALVLKAPTVDAPGDSVSNADFPHKTVEADIHRFGATLFVSGTSPSDGPREVLIGQPNVLVARLTTRVDRSYADIKTIKVRLSGDGSDDADLTPLSLYRSNGDEVLDEADQWVASASVDGAVAEFELGAERVNVSTSVYLIGASLSAAASPGDQLIFNLTNGDFELFSGAGTILSPEGGFETQPLIVKEPVSSLTVSNWTSLAPNEVFQTNANVEMAAFQVRMNAYTGHWKSLQVDRTSGANFLDQDVRVIRLYRDAGDRPGRYDGKDRLAGTGTFKNGSAVLNFLETQTMTTDPTGYVLTMDVAGNARPANTVGFQLSSAGSFVLPPDGVDNEGFPFKTEAAVVRPTVDELILNYKEQINIAPSEITQGVGPVAFLKIILTANSNQVTWQGLVVEKFGTLSDADVEKVRLFQDLNGNNVPELEEDITRGQPSFSQNIATLRPREDMLIPTSDIGSKNFWVMLDFSPLAPPLTTVKLKIKEFLVESPDHFKSIALEEVGNPNDSMVSDRPDKVLSSVEPLTNLQFSPTLYQGASHAAVLRLRLRTDEDVAHWTSLTALLNLEANSPLKPAHFLSYQLFRDQNRSGQLDPAEINAVVANGRFFEPEISFVLDIPETLTVDGPDYFLAVNLSLDAPAGEPFSVTVKDANAIKIKSPDVLDWRVGTSLNSPNLKVRNVKAPSTPVVADYEDPPFVDQNFLDGNYSPPDVTGRGQFNASAIQIPFTWGSEMGKDHGDIGSAEYCVGTAPCSDPNTGWKPMKPQPGVAIATGLNLSHGTTYYISVRARSAKYGNLSDVGVTNGIVVDLRVPETPIPEPPSIENTGYSLLWRAAPPTLSGIAGYILEERSENRPAWTQIRPASIGLARPELTTSGLSHTVVDKKPGTYYYRVIAVNGVGTRSDPSATVRVDYALAQAPSFISQNSNYPNPFDANSGPTKITYTLKEAGDVKLRIYDGFGREVREDQYSAGSPGATQGGNTIEWDGKDGEGQPLPQGTYVIRLNAGGEDVRWKIGVWR